MSDDARGDSLDPKELARVRRRDRDAEAEQRELLRPGMGKVFKQILDAQGTAATAAPTKKRKRKKRKRKPTKS